MYQLLYLCIFDIVCFRLKRDQQEFIDHRGLHVVVGHYLGDVNNVGTSANLTDGK